MWSAPLNHPIRCPRTPELIHSQLTECASRKLACCVGLWLPCWPSMAGKEQRLNVPPFSLVACSWPYPLPQLVGLNFRIHSWKTCLLLCCYSDCNFISLLANFSRVFCGCLGHLPDIYIYIYIYMPLSSIKCACFTHLIFPVSLSFSLWSSHFGSWPPQRISHTFTLSRYFSISLDIKMIFLESLLFCWMHGLSYTVILHTYHTLSINSSTKYYYHRFVMLLLSWNQVIIM